MVCRDGKLSYFPKPLDNDVVGGVAVLVLGVLPPVIHVHISKTAHEQLWGTRRQVDGPLFIFLEKNLVNFSTSGGLKTHLELVLIKDLDQILWYQLKESLKHKHDRFLFLLYTV